jgi:hypothetical protein
MNVEDFHAILGIYSLGLAIVGIPMNLICHVVCLRKSLRSVPTFIIISFLALFDAISLCFWNIDHFLHQFYGYVQEDLSIEMCRFATFSQCVSLQASSWLLVKKKIILLFLHCYNFLLIYR